MRERSIRLSAFEHEQTRGCLEALAEATHNLTSGNVAHKAPMFRDFATEGLACLDAARARAVARAGKRRAPARRRRG